jgi:hypothetical protein
MSPFRGRRGHEMSHKIFKLISKKSRKFYDEFYVANNSIKNYT